jgi:hypothetical protein
MEPQPCPTSFQTSYILVHESRCRSEDTLHTMASDAESPSQRTPGRPTTSLRSAGLVLINLRRNVAWSQPDIGRTNDVLSERLKPVLVFQLKKNGEKKYLNLSVRDLYRHVLYAISNRSDKTKSRATDKPTNIGAQMPKLHSVPVTLEATAPHDEEKGYGATGVTSALKMQKQQKVSFHDVATSTPSSSSPPLATATPRHPPPPVPPMRQGSVAPLTTEEYIEVTYRDRLGGYLHPRDMRRLVTPFSTSNEPEVIVRRHVMLLNFDPLRAIILRDRLLVIAPDGAEAMLARLENRVKAGGSHDDQFEKILSSVQSVPPLLVTETVPRGNLLLQRIFKRQTSSLSQQSVQQHADYRSMEETTSLSLKGKQSTTCATTTEHSDEFPSQGDNDDDWSNEWGEGTRLEWDEMHGHDWADLPFELQCADAVLHVVSSILSEDTLALQQASLEYIKGIVSNRGELADDPLSVIRAIKDAVGEMASRVKGFVKSLTAVLDQDSAMALMNLSRLLTHPERFIHPVSPAILDEESDEPELILEAHLQTALTLTNAIDLLQGQITSAAELVHQKLDAVRNKLLYANMMISIVSASAACAGLVGSFLGMNLLNHLESDAHAFTHTVIGTVIGALTLGIGSFLLLIHSGAIPRAGSV